MSPITCDGTSYLEYPSKVCRMSPRVRPAAAAFQMLSGVMR